MVHTTCILIKSITRLRKRSGYVLSIITLIRILAPAHTNVLKIKPKDGTYDMCFSYTNNITFVVRSILRPVRDIRSLSTLMKLLWVDGPNGRTNRQTERQTDIYDRQKVILFQDADKS